MAKFRKKRVVVEAVHWDGKQFSEVPKWLGKAMREFEVFMEGKFVKIKTLEGLMTANPDDWIIRGVNGELYPCKNEIFQKTYESVD